MPGEHKGYPGGKWDWRESKAFAGSYSPVRCAALAYPRFAVALRLAVHFCTQVQ